MRRYLKVRCSYCKQFYNVRYTSDLNFLGYRLDFSICSNCLKARKPELSMQYRKNWHCKGCGIPGSILLSQMRVAYRKIGRYCNLCYMLDWYEWKNGRRFKREVATKREIVCL